MRARTKQGVKKVGPRFLTKIPSTGSQRRPATQAALEYTRNHLGLQPDITTRPGIHPEADLNWWQRVRLVFREPLLEFWGVLVMVLLGSSTVAITYLSDYKDGNWLTICFGWSAGMMFGIYVAGDSGAYLNPAMTLTNCVFRGLPIRRWPSYALSQVLGSFCAQGLLYANYISAIDQYEGKGIRSLPPSETSTASFFCTFPESFTPIGSRFFSEFIANFMVTFLIFGVRDENGADLKGGGFFVIAFFWLNFVMIAAFGWETGSPSNPARDLTGRTWLSILGYKNAWSSYDYYFWIPVFVPFIGCFCGALAYDVFIYTGESPINNGEWHPKRLWNNLLVKLGMREKQRQGDEESLEEKKDHGEEDLGPSPIARLHHRNSLGNERESDTASDITRSGIQEGDWVPPTGPEYGDNRDETYTAKPGQRRSRFPREQNPRRDNPRFPREEEQEQHYTQEADMHDERNPDGRMRINEPVGITHAQKDGLRNMTGKHDTTVPPVYEGMPGKNGERIRNKNNKSTGYDDPR